MKIKHAKSLSLFAYILEYDQNSGDQLVVPFYKLMAVAGGNITHVAAFYIFIKLLLETCYFVLY